MSVCAGTLGDYAMANDDWRDDAIAAGQALLSRRRRTTWARRRGWRARSRRTASWPTRGALLDAAIAKHPDDERLRGIRVEVALTGSWAEARRGRARSTR